MLMLNEVKNNYIYNTFTVPWEKSKIVYCTSSRMESIVVFPALSRFSLK